MVDYDRKRCTLVLKAKDKYLNLEGYLILTVLSLFVMNKTKASFIVMDLANKPLFSNTFGSILGIDGLGGWLIMSICLPIDNGFHCLLASQ